MLAADAGFACTECVQYTLRDIPLLLDSELRRRANREGKSLNSVAIEALIRGVGLAEAPSKQRDVGDIANTWQEDIRFDDAIAEQRRVDEHLWR